MSGPSPQSLRIAPLALAVLGATVYGYLTSRIPSPAGIGVFWVSNLSAPWLLLAFVAGWRQRSWLWAALAGTLADLAAVTGFYASFLWVDAHEGPHATSLPVLTRIARHLPNWLWYVMTPWLGKAIVAGVVLGLLGCWWGRTRSLIAGAAICLAFVLEPLAWSLDQGFLPRPYLIWIGEASVGLVALVWLVTTRSHDAART